MGAKKLEGFDRVFPLIGGQGRYQWMLLAIAALASTNNFHHMGYTFLGATPDHWCKDPFDALSSSGSALDWSLEQIKTISIPPDATGTVHDQCSYYDLDYTAIKSKAEFGQSYQDVVTSIDYSTVETKSCSEWLYDTSIYKSTTVTEFNLVCGRRYLVGTIQASYMCGVLVGSLFLGALSDRVLGRRGCILFAVSCIMFGGFGVWLAPSYAVFTLFRFIIAVGASGSFQNRLTIMMEYCGPSSRATFAFLMWIPYCIVYMLMPLYVYFLREWRDLQLAFSTTTLVLISYFWIMPESSRWLAGKNRDEEAFAILERIATVNKRPVPSRGQLAAILESCKDKRDAEPKPKETEAPFAKRVFVGFKRLCRNWLNLVRTPELRRRSLILWYIFMSVTLVYYGIAFEAPNLSDNPFVTVFLGAFAEIPGYAGGILFAKWGRKPATALMFLVTGLASIGLGMTPTELVWLRVAFYMIGRMFITGCFALVYVLAAELYPTEERATGVAASALTSRIGAISAPYVALTRTIHPELPTIVFAIAALLAGLVAFLLPETKDKELLEHVDEVEELAAVPALRARAGSQQADGAMKCPDGIGLSEINGSADSGAQQGKTLGPAV